MKYIIVGIDPGTTTGLACLSLRGELIKTVSYKNAGKEKVIRMISELGTPVVIACDRIPVPSFVLSVKAKFNAKLFAELLTNEEKDSITKRYHLKNKHEKDALAAAIKAYNYYSSKIRNVMKHIKELSPEKQEHVIKEVLFGRRIRDVLSELK